MASFINGAYLGRDRTTTTAFLDLDRIEIVLVTRVQRATYGVQARWNFGNR